MAQRLALIAALAMLVACSGKAKPAAATHSRTVEELSPTELRDRVNGFNADVVVMKSTGSFAEYRDVLAAVLATPGVTAAEAMVLEEVLVEGSAGKPSVGVVLKGIDARRAPRVLTILSHVTTGSFAAMAADPQGALVGDILATTLGVHVGDNIKLTLPPSAAPAQTPSPQATTATFVVRGIFHADFDEYDRRVVFANLGAVQTFLGRGDTVLSIEATVKEIDHADIVARAIETKLGDNAYRVIDWYELNRAVFKTKP